MCREVEFGLSLEEGKKPSEGLGFPRQRCCGHETGGHMAASQDALDFKLMSIETKVRT